MVDAHTENLPRDTSLFSGFLTMGNRELGVWLFLLSDALTFAAMLLSYAYLRITGSQFPTPFTFNPDILLACGMTFALIMGALLWRSAVKEATGMSRRWLTLTLIAAILFIVLQVKEWLDLVNAGLSFSSLPQSWRAVWSNAAPVFGATFFTITGFHLLHVAVAVLLLIWFIVRIDRISQEQRQAFRLYWNFICVTWLVVFGFVYLLSIDTQGLLRR